MNFKKRLSILVAFMLLVMTAYPITSTFAAENKQETTTNEKNSKKDEQVQKNSNVAVKNSNQKDNTNSDGKAASTENESNTEEGSDSDKTNEQEQVATNEAEETENNANQEDNSAKEENASEENNATEGDNASEESNASEENNVPEEENTSEENNAAEDSENESTPADEENVPANENKSTQIHLHIDKCVNPLETVFVQVNGVWEEMTNPGSSPLYKSFDDGEFVKDDVTAFKLNFTSGEELIVPVSDVRVGVEAEGSVNYWLESCELPEEEPSEPDDSDDADLTMKLLSMIKVMIDETQHQVENVTLVMMNGKRIEFERINGLFSLNLTEEIELDLIRGIEITNSGETKLFLLSQIESLEIVDSVLTLQLNWDMEGEMAEEETGEEESDKDTDTTVPGNNTGSGNPPDGTTNEQVWNGEVLPQTGESSRAMFYVLGFLIAAGGVILRFKNPLRN